MCMGGGGGGRGERGGEGGVRVGDPNVSLHPSFHPRPLPGEGRG